MQWYLAGLIDSDDKFTVLDERLFWLVEEAAGVEIKAEAGNHSGPFHKLMFLHIPIFPCKAHQPLVLLSYYKDVKDVGIR